MFELGPPGECNPSWEWARPDRTYPHRARLSQTVATRAPYTDTVTRGSTARATRRAVPLPANQQTRSTAMQCERPPPTAAKKESETLRDCRDFF